MTPAMLRGRPIAQSVSIPLNFDAGPDLERIYLLGFDAVGGPTAAEFYSAVPLATREKQVGGRAAMRCKVTITGAVQNCGVVIDYPTGYGFGEALLSLAPKIRLKPRMVDGAPVETEVTIPASWFNLGPARGYYAKADWLRKPTSEDLIDAWPLEAWKQRLGGSAMVDCRVDTGGRLTDCVVLAEDPPGRHFGEAAVYLTPRFLLKPATVAGTPVDSVVQIPLNFRLVIQ
jgi:TonB family protein